MKQCSKCNIIKSLEDFSNDKTAHSIQQQHLNRYLYDAPKRFGNISLAEKKTRVW